MNKKIFFFIPLLSIFCGCSVVEKKADLLSAPGMEKQPEIFPENMFQPYSKVIVPYASGWMVKNPLKQPSLAVIFKGITLDPKGIYELRMRYVGQENSRLFLYGLEYQKGKIRKNNILLNTVSFLNVNGPAEYRKKFAVSPDCDQLLPALTINHSGKKGNAVELLVEELAVYRVGTMKTASKALKKIDLAADFDFSKYPEGDFNKIRKGHGQKAKKWSDVKAEIVKLNGEKVLHIVRTPENYIYPYMDLKPFPVDPEYYFVKLTFQAKGKGSIRPGLWWKRAVMTWDYYHEAEVKLTDKWQTVTVLHPCMTPDVKRATMSFSSKGQGEFWIKDISVTLQ